MDRILLKISGESLKDTEGELFSSHFIKSIVSDIEALHDAGKKIAIVIGGGNIFRGKDKDKLHLSQTKADQVGMLATILNALVFQTFFTKPAVVMSAIACDLCAHYNIDDALDLFNLGNIVICAGGTSVPFFTTDTAAVVRARELECDLLIKATNTDGIYSADPKVYPQAEFYPQLTYAQVLEKRLNVMDMVAFELAQAAKLPIIVTSINQHSPFSRVIENKIKHTIVTTE